MDKINIKIAVCVLVDRGSTIFEHSKELKLVFIKTNGKKKSASERRKNGKSGFKT